MTIVDSLTTKQLAARWGITTRALELRRYRKSCGGPPYFRIGSGARAQVRYKLADIIEYERAHRMEK